MWQPTLIRYSFEAFATSTGPVRVVTDAGIGYLKALGNDQGPHALVREYVGTSIARYLGLATLDFALIEISAEDSITLGNGSKAMPGPAFITKELENSISGIVDTSKVINVADFTGIVVADTLLMNRTGFLAWKRESRDMTTYCFRGYQGKRKRNIGSLRWISAIVCIFPAH